MKKIIGLFQQGELKQAITSVELSLKDDPTNVDYRSALIELLCVNNELERADQQLNIMVQRHPDSLIGATNLRQLIRAQQARIDFQKGLVTPEIFNKINSQLSAFMQLRVELNEGEETHISEAANKLESARPGNSLDVDGVITQDVRDLDDSLNGCIEIFGTNGKFYIAQLSEIEFIEFKAPTSLVEYVWRRVELSIKDGPSGEAHIPLVYISSESDKQKLGKETDWIEKSQNVYIGQGLKMLLVGEKAIPLSDITSIKLAQLETI